MPVKPRILIIEDNPVNAKLLTLFLEAEGFDVLHGIDGHSGIDIANAHTDINVILLDRIMPDMDGLEVLKALKRGATSWRVPVIMTTAALSKAQIEEAKMYGAHGCLPKPYDKGKIIAMIHEAMKGPQR